MKRYLVAGAVGSAVFAAAFGSAAALDINDPGVAQYGQSFDLQCDEDGVNVDGYTPDTQMRTGAVTTDRLTVSGIDDDCDGKTLVAVVADGSGARLARGTALITGNTHTVRFDDGATVPAKAIEGVRLLIG